MRHPLHFWVIGGDHRSLALAESLSADGHKIHTYALGPDPALAADTLDSARAADCVILPLPAHKGETLNAPLASAPPPLAQVLDALASGQLVCAGMVSPELEAEAQRRGLVLADYFAREELAVANAVPVALAV